MSSRISTGAVGNRIGIASTRSFVDAPDHVEQKSSSRWVRMNLRRMDRLLGCIRAACKAAGGRPRDRGGAALAVGAPSLHPWTRRAPSAGCSRSPSGAHAAAEPLGVYYQAHREVKSWRPRQSVPMAGVVGRDCATRKSAKDAGPRGCRTSRDVVTGLHCCKP